MGNILYAILRDLRLSKHTRESYFVSLQNGSITERYRNVHNAITERSKSQWVGPDFLRGEEGNKPRLGGGNKARKGGIFITYQALDNSHNGNNLTKRTATI